MSIDITPVAGFTITISKELEKDLLDAHQHDHLEELFEEKDLSHETVGSHYIGNVKYILLFQPKGARNLDSQMNNWLNSVNKALSTTFTLDNVKFVSDYCES